MKTNCIHQFLLKLKTSTELESHVSFVWNSGNHTTYFKYRITNSNSNVSIKKPLNVYEILYTFRGLWFKILELIISYYFLTSFHAR